MYHERGHYTAFGRLFNRAAGAIQRALQIGHDTDRGNVGHRAKILAAAACIADEIRRNGA